MLGIGILAVRQRHHHVDAEAERKFSAQMVMNGNFKPGGGGSAATSGKDSGTGASAGSSNAGPATLLELQRSDITFGSPVRAGAFGQLLDGRISFRDNNVTKTRRVLIKQLDLPSSLQSIPAVRSMAGNMQDLSEREFLKDAGTFFDFEHPNVAKVIGVVTVGDPCLVLFECFGHGTLKDYLKRNAPQESGVDPVPTRRRLQMCIDITEGLAYLHSKRYLHRDLCSRNVLVAEGLVLKLGDFSLNPKAGTVCARLLLTAEHRDGVYPPDLFMSGGQRADLDLARKETECWPPVRWLASECFSGSNFSNASDVWALAVTFYEIYTHAALPFAGKSQDAIEVLVNVGMRMNKPEAMPPPIYLAAIDCWALNPTDRPPLGALSMILNRMKWADHEDVVRHWNRVVKGDGNSAPGRDKAVSPSTPPHASPGARGGGGGGSGTAAGASDGGGFRAPTALRHSVGRATPASHGDYFDPASQDPAAQPSARARGGTRGGARGSAGTSAAAAPAQSADLNDWWAGMSGMSSATNGDKGVAIDPRAAEASDDRVDHTGRQKGPPASGGGGSAAGGGGGGREPSAAYSPRKLPLRNPPEERASVRELGDGAVVMDPSIRVPTPPPMHFYPARGIRPATKAIKKKEISVPRRGSFVHVQHVNMKDGSAREQDHDDLKAAALEETARLQRSFGADADRSSSANAGATEHDDAAMMQH